MYTIIMAFVHTAGAKKHFFWQDGRKAPFWLTWPIFKGYTKKLEAAGKIHVEFLDQLKLETIYRLTSAAKLYFERKINKIFLAGGQTGQRQKVSVVMMRNFLMEIGVRRRDIILDPNTLQTSDSIKVFSAYIKSLENYYVTAYIITSWYHIPRSLYHLKKLLPAFDRRIIKYKATWPTLSKECLKYEYAFNLLFEPLKLLSMPFESATNWWRNREEKLREVKK